MIMEKFPRDHGEWSMITGVKVHDHGELGATSGYGLRARCGPGRLTGGQVISGGNDDETAESGRDHAGGDPRVHAASRFRLTGAQELWLLSGRICTTLTLDSVADLSLRTRPGRQR